MYDCLRANKSMMGWGVEARVPFLDRVFLDYAMNLDPEVKMCPGSKIEKNCLRSAFDTPEDEYLPHEILWRQKEQFSGEIRFIFLKVTKSQSIFFSCLLMLQITNNFFTDVCPSF